MARDSIPASVWTWLRSELSEVSDEIGAVRRGRWLLLYEGWSGFCVDCIWDSNRSKAENEAAAYSYAEEQSAEIIREWREEYSSYELVESGYMPTGLYGVTWAVMKKPDRA